MCNINLARSCALHWSNLAVFHITLCSHDEALAGGHQPDHWELHRLIHSEIQKGSVCRGGDREEGGEALQQPGGDF